jgi:hypothetical protein
MPDYSSLIPVAAPTGRPQSRDVSPLMAAAAALWVAELELPVDPVELAIH